MSEPKDKKNVMLPVMVDAFSGEPSQVHPRVLAYLGDAVYELSVRMHAVNLGLEKTEDLHHYVTARVNAQFQEQALGCVEALLTDTEQDWVRRGRNVALSPKKGGQASYRKATGFEALMGFTYLTDRERYNELIATIVNEAFSDAERKK